ncbi:hypothetical protein [Flavobacterium sp.]|uniref:hypothetical protein n=1 Tax=Flavobacterium sp. TaxID=239 RepID=UPI00261DAB23|nr:hypothetical protein [Flavobacterium sp.]
MKVEVELMLKNELTKSKFALKRKAKRLYNNSEGGLSLIEGNNFLDNKDYFNALLAYTHSINFYRKAKNFVVIQNIILNVIECFDKIKRSDLERLKKESRIDINEILSKVLNQDKYGVTRNIILDDLYEQFTFFEKPILRKIKSSKAQKEQDTPSSL